MVGEIVQLKDNTAVKRLRTDLGNDYLDFTERMDRLKARVQDEIGEFQKETRESMPNRVGDGFEGSTEEFAAMVTKIMSIVNVGCAAIVKNTFSDLIAYIGPEAFCMSDGGKVRLVPDKIGGKLAAVAMPIEQDQLKIVALQDAVDVDEGDEPPAK
jgi:hypothetical protein